MSIFWPWNQILTERLVLCSTAVSFANETCSRSTIVNIADFVATRFKIVNATIF